MSSVPVNIDDCYDYIEHCDPSCKRVLSPYLSQIERSLDPIFYPGTRIPTVLESLCAAYYCPHVTTRLSFKHFFAKSGIHHFCQYQHHYDAQQCQYDWVHCPHIQRMIFILKNYQTHISLIPTSHNTSVAAYTTYQHYQVGQILSDLDHIATLHPENSVRFFMRSQTLPDPNNAKHSDNCCTHSTDSDDNLYEISSREEWIAHTMSAVQDKYIVHSDCERQLDSAVSHIVAHNVCDVADLLMCLRSVARKLGTYDVKYCTLDTTNPVVQERLMGFEGVIHYLSLLGFEANMMETKLICKYPPSPGVITWAVAAIDKYSIALSESKAALDSTAAATAAAAAGTPEESPGAVIRKKEIIRRFGRGIRRRVNSITKKRFDEVEDSGTSANVAPGSQPGSVDAEDGKAKRVLVWVGSKVRRMRASTR